jgi:hypothetical protein
LVATISTPLALSVSDSETQRENDRFPYAREVPFEGGCAVLGLADETIRHTAPVDELQGKSLQPISDRRRAFLVGFIRAGRAFAVVYLIFMLVLIVSALGHATWTGEAWAHRAAWASLLVVSTWSLANARARETLDRQV